MQDQQTPTFNDVIEPRNLEERLIWHAIRYTWVFYLFGALYVVGPVVGWSLCGVLVWRVLQGQNFHLSPAIVCWIVGMLVMLLATFIGHINLDLAMGSLIKSVIGWAKGWALLAVFPLLACLDIRPKVIVRASMHLSKQCLYIIPFVVLAAIVHLPAHLYTSPLKFLASPAFFQVELYGLNSFDGMARWRLFAPWGPALGLIGNAMFCLSLFEKDKKWRWIGIIASIIMVLLSKSRMGLLCLLAAPVITWGLSNLNRLVILAAIAISAPVAAGLYVPAKETFESVTNQIHAARANSSRVRGALERIALERWRNEAPIWGHGVVENGPHYVEYMPIGSHHSWYGLLFVKGIVGLVALAIPILLSLLIAVQKCWQSTRFNTPQSMPWVGLHLLILLCFYSLSENLEILAYLYWPSLIMIGITLNRPRHFLHDA